jgi:DNA-binding phage protein
VLKNIREIDIIVEYIGNYSIVLQEVIHLRFLKDDALIYCYMEAQLLKLDDSFINMLLTEMTKRNIDISKVTTSIV